jgi:hypothetical protein
MLFLLIAAFIEAYWSSMTAPSPLIKYLVGAALWMLMAAYLLFAGRTAMRLSDASVVIRPRPTWEAMDLGVLLSQRHRRLLMTSWAIVTLPVFVLLSAVSGHRRPGDIPFLVAETGLRTPAAVHSCPKPCSVKRPH